MSKTQQTGRGSGITGLVDLPGFAAKFEASISRYKVRQNGSTRGRRGRGGGVYRTARWVFSSGTIVVSGTLHSEGWPAPDAWKGQEGSIVVKLGRGKTATYPILINDAGIDYDEAKHDEAQIYLAAEVTGSPTYAGWSGTQPAATDPTKEDQEQWGGPKTIDPQGIQSSAQTIIDIWGDLSDTDGAEETKLIDVIGAATAPMSGMKLRTGTLRRDAIDGGSIVINWGLTDTAEDVINSLSSVTVDPDGRDDQQNTAAINGTPPAPDDETLFAGPTTTKELNDGTLAKVKRWTRETPVQAIEHGGTHTADDPDDIGIRATLRKYRTNATVSAPAAPHGLLIGWDIRQDRDANGSYVGRWIHDYFYGTTTAKQSIEQQGAFDIDVAGINDQDVQTLVGTSSTPPADPSARVAGLQIVRRRGQKLQNTPEKWRFTYTFARLTSEESIEHRGTSAAADILGNVPASGTKTHETLLDTCSSGDGVDALLGNLVSSLEASTTRPWLAANVRKVHKTKFATDVTYPLDDKAYVWSPPRTGYERRALDATGAYLRVPVAYAYGSGQKKIYISHWEHRITRQVLRLRRYWRTDHIEDVSFDAYVGTRCSDAAGFLGKPQYTVAFIGPAGAGNWINDGTSSWYRMDYLFEYCAGRDSGGALVDMNWVDSAIPRDQWLVTTASITVPGTPAASTVDSTYIVQTLVNASYVSFLA